MHVRELIELLTNLADDFGDLPVNIGWTPDATPGEVVAVKVHRDVLELRCEREATGG